MNWVPMINDLAVGTVSTAYKAGLVSFRLAIFDQEKDGDVDWDFVPAWAGYPTGKPDKYRIRANIYQCAELPASDDNGTSDPYVKFYTPFNPDEKQLKLVKTKVVQDNNNPIFYQCIQSIFYCTDIEYAPPIVLEIFDRDSGTFDSDDFIGRAVIPMSEASICKGEEILEPKWHPIKLGFRPDEPAMGKILCSFFYIDPGLEFEQSLTKIRLGPQ